MCDCCSQERNILIIAPGAKQGKEGKKDNPDGNAPQAK